MFKNSRGKVIPLREGNVVADGDGGVSIVAFFRADSFFERTDQRTCRTSPLIRRKFLIPRIGARS